MSDQTDQTEYILVVGQVRYMLLSLSHGLYELTQMTDLVQIELVGDRLVQQSISIECCEPSGLEALDVVHLDVLDNIDELVDTLNMRPLLRKRCQSSQWQGKLRNQDALLEEQ